MVSRTICLTTPTNQRAEWRKRCPYSNMGNVSLSKLSRKLQSTIWPAGAAKNGCNVFFSKKDWWSIYAQFVSNQNVVSKQTQDGAERETSLSTGALGDITKGRASVICVPTGLY